MKVYAIAELRGYDGTVFDRKMYFSKETAEAIVKERNVEKAKENDMTVKGLFSSDENYEVRVFEVE